MSAYGTSRRTTTASAPGISRTTLFVAISCRRSFWLIACAPCLAAFEGRRTPIPIGMQAPAGMVRSRRGGKNKRPSRRGPREATQPSGHAGFKVRSHCIEVLSSHARGSIRRLRRLHRFSSDSVLTTAMSSPLIAHTRIPSASSDRAGRNAAGRRRRNASGGKTPLGFRGSSLRCVPPPPWRVPRRGRWCASRHLWHLRNLRIDLAGAIRLARAAILC